MVGGLKYPVASSVFGGLWLASRVFYMKGYSSDKNVTQDKKSGKGRYAGGLGTVHPFAELGLMLLAGYTGLGLVLGW